MSMDDGICCQAVIDANIIPALIDIMGRAEFKTRKEAAWAITNAVSGGSAEQIRFLVDQGCIPPLCNLLTVMDGKIVQVALNGLEHVLRAGLQESKQHGGVNMYAVAIEECYGRRRFTYSGGCARYERGVSKAWACFWPVIVKGSSTSLVLFLGTGLRGSRMAS